MIGKQPTFYQFSRRVIDSHLKTVSLTSQICKLFETVIRNAMVNHLESKHLISDSQHGFRKRRSCLTNLLEFLDIVTGCVDSGGCVDVILLDFAKAFDKAPHGLLITGRIAAKWQTAGIKFTHRQKIRFFARRGDLLHRFQSNFAGPTGTWVRLAMQNFTSIATGGGNEAQKMSKISTFW